MKTVNFLKKILSKSILLFAGLLIMTSVSGAQINPWPWGRELPFPWTSIEGLWHGASADESIELLYSFEVLNPQRGPRQIRILQVNPETLGIIASGLGVESKRVVRALMVGADGISYQVSVRLVKEKKAATNSPTFTVLTMEAVGDSAEKFTTHLTLTKVSDLPVQKTDADEKNQNSCSTTRK